MLRGVVGRGPILKIDMAATKTTIGTRSTPTAETETERGNTVVLAGCMMGKERGGTVTAEEIRATRTRRGGGVEEVMIAIESAARSGAITEPQIDESIQSGIQDKFALLQPKRDRRDGEMLIRQLSLGMAPTFSVGCMDPRITAVRVAVAGAVVVEGEGRLLRETRAGWNTA